MFKFLKVAQKQNNTHTALSYNFVRKFPNLGGGPLRDENVQVGTDIVGLKGDRKRKNEGTLRGPNVKRRL